MSISRSWVSGTKLHLRKSTLKSALVYKAFTFTGSTQTEREVGEMSFCRVSTELLSTNNHLTVIYKPSFSLPPPLPPRNKASYPHPVLDTTLTTKDWLRTDSFKLVSGHNDPNKFPAGLWVKDKGLAVAQIDSSSPES